MAAADPMLPYRLQRPIPPAIRRKIVQSLLDHWSRRSNQARKSNHSQFLLLRLYLVHGKTKRQVRIAPLCTRANSAEYPQEQWECNSTLYLPIFFRRSRASLLLRPTSAPVPPEISVRTGAE